LGICDDVVRLPLVKASEALNTSLAGQLHKVSELVS